MAKGARSRSRGTWPHNPRRTLVAGSVVFAGVAVAGAALGQYQAQDQNQAQTPTEKQAPLSSSSLFRPSLEDARTTPSFRRNAKPSPRARSEVERRPVGQIPTYNFPSGAGSTGFISSNVPPTTPSTASPSSSPTDAQPTGDLVPVPVTTEEPVPADETVVIEPPPGDELAPPAVIVRKRKRVDLTDPYDPLGIRAGAFILRPAVELTGGFNSNPSQATSPDPNSMFIVAPELRVQSDWSRHELRADLRGSYTAFPGLHESPSPDRPLIDAKVDGRIDVSHQTRIELQGRFRLSTEDPNSPNLPAGLQVLPISIAGGVSAGVAHAFNRFELGLKGSYDRIIYAPSHLTDGEVISNDDRNYDQYGLKLRGAYELMPGVKPFVELGGDTRIHDLPVDSAGFRRDSVAAVASVGSTMEFSRQLTGAVSIGYAQRNYQDPNLTDLVGIVADGLLIWEATPLTKVTLTARSTVEESTLAGVSGVLQRDFGIQIDHSFRRWLIGTLKFGYGNSDYVGSTRDDQRWLVGGQLTYKMSRELWLKGEIRREWQTSNALGGDYAANIFLLGIRLQR
jgi:hypothetical protein